MKLAIKTALILLVCLSTAWAFQKTAKRSKFIDETYGYTLELPKFPGAGPTTAGTVLAVTGPGANGFAPNVNVTVQAKATTAQAYRDLSVSQFKQLGLKLNSEKMLKVSDRDAVQFDYEGVIPGVTDRSVRFLAVAVVEKDRVVLVTCAALPANFPALEAEFQACLKSLKFP